MDGHAEDRVAVDRYASESGGGRAQGTGWGLQQGSFLARARASEGHGLLHRCCPRLLVIVGFFVGTAWSMTTGGLHARGSWGELGHEATDESSIDSACLGSIDGRRSAKGDEET